MRRAKKMLFLAALVAVTATGCSGGGGGGGAAVVAGNTTYTMSDVKLQNPDTIGTQGGFSYSTLQKVTVDIKLAYPNGIVTIYESRPLTSIYDANGNLLPTPVITEPAVLAQGLTSRTMDTDGFYHYRETIVVPTATSTIYLATPGRIDLPIKSGTVTYQGGA